MITYGEYQDALIINKADIPEPDFPAYAAEAERLILAEVTKEIPSAYIQYANGAACELCHLLYKDAQVSHTAEPIVKSRSYSLGNESRSESYDVPVAAVGGQAAYSAAIRKWLLKCDGEWTGLFYAGVDARGAL